MITQLAEFVATAPLADTHEHQCSAVEWAASPPDILGDVVDWYLIADLTSAGAPSKAFDRFWDISRDIAERWQAIEPWWSAVEHTGYGQAALLTAQRCYGLNKITGERLAEAASKAASWRQTGGRDRLFRQLAGLSQVQIDSFTASPTADVDDPAYYRYDLSFASLASGHLDVSALTELSGLPLIGPDDLRPAVAQWFASRARLAVAVKSQHAYERTLAWRRRSDDEVRPLLVRALNGEELSSEERLVMGDWWLDYGASLCAEHGLPFKIHTGHLAGNGCQRLDQIRPALLCGLVATHPETKFVLMHAGWPYDHELVSMAKHFANVWGDCCWAWAMNPRATADFVRNWLHAAPANKLLTFGGDTGRPTQTVGYAAQVRLWLTRALAAEVADGELAEAQAIALAGRLMNGNAAALFGG